MGLGPRHFPHVWSKSHEPVLGQRFAVLIDDVCRGIVGRSRRVVRRDRNRYPVREFALDEVEPAAEIAPIEELCFVGEENGNLGVNVRGEEGRGTPVGSRGDHATDPTRLVASEPIMSRQARQNARIVCSVLSAS